MLRDAVRPLTADERDRPVDQVAEAVGELVRARGELRLAEVGVAAARHVAQKPPAERVGSVASDEVGWVDRVAE